MLIILLRIISRGEILDKNIFYVSDIFMQFSEILYSISGYV
jgi:hypothetical protein